MANVISLGYNCEISFRIENYYGKINAMPFSWSFVLEREKFPSVLADIDQLFTGEVELLEDHMILCKNTNIKFHPRYDVLLKNGDVTDNSYEEAVQELRNRVAHLRKKWKALMEGNESTIFLMKVENKGEDLDYNYIKQVCEGINKVYHSGNYQIYAILEKNGYSEKIKALENEKLKIRVLKKFAPRKHTDTMGDVWGWWKILNEISGRKNWIFFKRLWKKRISWFFAVVKKYLGIKGGH